MSKIRRQHSAEFKLKAVVEVLKGEKTAAQLAGELEVHPVVLSEWKKQLTDNGPQIFTRGNKPKNTDTEKAELFEQIGRLKMELEWLKKKLGKLT